MRADVMFVNGRIYTGLDSRPLVDAVAVRAGRIVAVGADAVAMQAECRVDLRGAPVVPGFHDAHFHLSGLGQSLQRCDLRELTSLDALGGRLAAYAAEHKHDAWVIGEGFDDRLLGGMPTRDSLDQALGDRPTWIVHASHHAGVVNSAGLKRLGFDNDVPDVTAGVVGRDATGRANGYLAEHAVDLVHRALRPQPFVNFVDAIGRGSDAALAMGITSVTEPGISGTLTGNGPDDYAAFEAALTAGRLRVRATVMPELSAVQAGLQRERCPTHPHRLRLGGVKIFADGAFSTRTAAVIDDYAHPANAGNGLLLISPQDLRTVAAQLHAEGWQLATHAIGDRAIDAVLDAYAFAQAALPRVDPRHRIEHAGLLHDHQVDRLRVLGAIPVPQARFLTEFHGTYVEALGAERASRVFRQRSLLEAGIVVPGSSDCPVVDGSPLLGIDALVHRSDTHGSSERVRVEQALRSFTFGSAYAEHSEADKGSLGVGKLADMVVLSDDLLQVTSTRIREIRVVATIIGGAIVHGDLT